MSAVAGEFNEIRECLYYSNWFTWECILPKMFDTAGRWFRNPALEGSLFLEGAGIFQILMRVRDKARDLGSG